MVCIVEVKTCKRMLYTLSDMRETSCENGILTEVTMRQQLHSGESGKLIAVTMRQ